jgi:hypothetical protein
MLLLPVHLFCRAIPRSIHRVRGPVDSTSGQLVHTDVSRERLPWVYSVLTEFGSVICVRRDIAS